MLSHITISNYALIKSLDLSLNNGFTVITGETGAGKSILLGALGLVLGNRAETKVLANDDSKCIVEATFSIHKLNLKPFFERHDLDFDNHCILRREILPSGKSRAFINDTPVRLDVMKSLGERLIDIHSQHDSITLLDPAFQLEMIDSLAGNKNEREVYRKEYATYKSLLAEKEELLNELSVERDTDYLQFLADELEAANLQKNEENELEKELEVLRHAEDIQVGLASASTLLQTENGLLENLHEAIRTVESSTKYLPEAEELLERFKSTEIELKDIGEELDAFIENVQHNPGRLSDLEDRYSALQHLLTKHRLTSVEELIDLKSNLNQQLALAVDGAKALEKKEKEINQQFVLLSKAGKTLHESRIKTSKQLEVEIAGYLEKLQLPHAKLAIAIQYQEKPQKWGFDDIQFLFSANMGSKPLALHKVASGGELSRVMLALKAILARSKSLPSIVFDEIDTGVSGETAKRVAAILNGMGEEMQVIAITHLPQIAASGKYHLKVRKAVVGKETVTEIYKLPNSQRIEEVAGLLSGATISEAARETAQELLAI